MAAGLMTMALLLATADDAPWLAKDFRAYLEKAPASERVLVALDFIDFAAAETKGLDREAARAKRIELFPGRTKPVATKAGELAAKVGEEVRSVDPKTQTISVRLDAKGVLALADWAAGAELKDRFRITPLEEKRWIAPPEETPKDATEDVRLAPVTERTLTILARGGIALAAPKFEKETLVAKTNAAGLERLRADGLLGTCSLAERREFRSRWAEWEKEELPVEFTIAELDGAKIAALAKKPLAVRFESIDGTKAKGRGTAAAVAALKQAKIVSGDANEGAGFRALPPK